MGTTQHTPGPWYVYDTWHQFEIIPSEDLNEPPLCVVERPSDARLIAAAPELLAACIDALEVEENMAQCPDSELAKRLRAAIAKAKGQ